MHTQIRLYHKFCKLQEKSWEQGVKIVIRNLCKEGKRKGSYLRKATSSIILLKVRITPQNLHRKQISECNHPRKALQTRPLTPHLPHKPGSSNGIPRKQ